MQRADSGGGGLAVFVAVTFAVTWAAWLPLLMNARFGAALPTVPLQFFLASFGPALGALAASYRTGGGQGVRRWLRRAFALRIGRSWWFAAVGMPVAYLVVGYGAAWVTTGTVPDLGGFGLTSKLPGVDALGVAAVWVLTFGVGEEAGWRGWLLPELARRYGTFRAAPLVAAVWIGWHLPASFFNPTYVDMGWGILGWMIALVAGSYLLAWMGQGAGWSVVPVLVWHAGFDLLTAADQSAGVIASSISAVVIVQGVAAAWWLWRGDRRGSRDDRRVGRRSSDHRGHRLVDPRCPAEHPDPPQVDEGQIGRR
ncbi:MAG: CPBP family glutamic-type intramembrane protease [Cellulomonas sp.]|nr:CPBP family glutamic-type intramembrane protease [Cellulomonas sp.]